MNTSFETFDIYKRSLDKRILDGNDIEEIQRTKGYKLIFGKLESFRYEAMRQSLLLSNDSKAGTVWRARLSAFDMVFGIIDGFLKERETAIQELKTEGMMPSEIQTGPANEREADLTVEEAPPY